MVFPSPKLTNGLFFKAVNHQPVERVPVWMMRQAGRSDPAYLEYREKSGKTLHQLFRSPEDAVEISLLPQRFGVDAIIFFQDILTPLEPMGADFHFVPGPKLAGPVRSKEDVAKLHGFDPASALPYVAQTLKGINRRLDGALPLLGFAGAPFTLAAFLVEGGSPSHGMETTLRMARQEPELFGRLMEVLTEATTHYLNYQIESGVHAVQLFESVGDQIPADLYGRFAHPSHQKILAGLKKETPSILFVKGSPFPGLMLDSGAAVLSVAGNVHLGQLLEQGKGKIAVQGNVNNQVVANGTPAQVEEEVKKAIAQTGGRGHILNLDHGLLPETPFANVEAVIQSARRVKLG